MKDNNKTALSSLKAYRNIERLLKVQEMLNNSKIIQEAKSKKRNLESCSAVNPII